MRESPGWLERLLRPRRAAAAPESPAGATASAGPPRLPDPAEQVADARRRAERDPAEAIRYLEALRETYAPDARVLHVLCLLYQRSGMTDRAIEVAREALPLCFRAGQGILAADLFDALDADAAALGLGRSELLAVGGALARTARSELAFRALATVVLRDPEAPDAVGEMIRLADQHARLGHYEDALKVLSFLAATCPSGEQLGSVSDRIAEIETTQPHLAPRRGIWRELAASVTEN